MFAKFALLGGLIILLGSCGTADNPRSGSVDAQGAPTMDAAAGNQLTDGPLSPADASPEASPDAPSDAPADAPGSPADGGMGEASAGDAGLDGDALDGGTAGDTGAMCSMTGLPYGPFDGCVPPPSPTTCDPVCQSGCGCGERCDLYGGKAVCRAQDPPFLQQYDACEPKNDQCRPGTICLQESQDQPACGAHCYRHCRTDSDCSNAKCTIEVQFGSAATTSKVCSPPMDACTPFGPAKCSNLANRPYPTFACYVMSSGYPDTPICDCAGPTPIGMPCVYEHQCEPGAECVLFGQARLCRRVCKVGAPAGTPVDLGGCPYLNPTCTAFPGGSQFGYCH